MSQQDLFMQPAATDTCQAEPDYGGVQIRLSSGAALFKGVLLPVEQALWQMLGDIAGRAPFRRRLTPGGQRMSAAMTNCGTVGWVTDANGYRYSATEPETGHPWPELPEQLKHWACQLAHLAGYGVFQPDSCLVNRYQPGTGMGLHQDRDEADFSAPIVSFSLGAPVCFRWGGWQRSDPAEDILLEHGDVLVWGGEDRLRFHGVKKLRRFSHPLTGHNRFNLTFRQALAVTGCQPEPDKR